MARIDETLDRIPLRVILLIDVAVAIMFGIGPKVLVRVIPVPATLAEQMGWVVNGLLVGGCLVVLGGAVALLSRSVEHSAVRVHALGLAVLVSVLCAWAVSILIHGTPAGVRFSWTPGILTGAAAWAAFVAGRAVSSWPLTPTKARFYAALAGGLAVLPVDIGVVIRIIADFLNRKPHGEA